MKNRVDILNHSRGMFSWNACRVSNLASSEPQRSEMLIRTCLDQCHWYKILSSPLETASTCCLREEGDLKHEQIMEVFV